MPRNPRTESVADGFAPEIGSLVEAQGCNRYRLPGQTDQGAQKASHLGPGSGRPGGAPPCTPGSSLRSCGPNGFP